MQPPPAQGVRLAWQAVPATVRSAAEEWLGSPIVSAISQPTGFTPGVAARLRTADGRRVFAKAAGPVPNPDVPAIHRREARITAALPASSPVPRLLWSHDDPATGWIVMLFDEIEGHHPAQPWQADELDRVLAMLTTLSAALTPSPLPAGLVPTASDEFSQNLRGWQNIRAALPTFRAGLDDWSLRHLDALATLEAAAPAAVAGNTLLHFDIRADNMLLASDRVWLIDWPLACVGAAWVDIIGFAPSVTMQGGPSCDDMVMRHPASQAADPDAITSAVVSVAGYFIYKSLLPPPPGLPTVRAFQAAQGVIARQWIAQRTGWQ